MKWIYIITLISLSFNLSFQDVPVKGDNDDLINNGTIDLSKFNESLEIDIVATHAPKDDSQSVQSLWDKVLKDVNTINENKLVNGDDVKEIREKEDIEEIREKEYVDAVDVNDTSSEFVPATSEQKVEPEDILESSENFKHAKVDDPIVTTELPVVSNLTEGSSEAVNVDEPHHEQSRTLESDKLAVETNSTIKNTVDVGNEDLDPVPTSGEPKENSENVVVESINSSVDANSNVEAVAEVVEDTVTVKDKSEVQEPRVEVAGDAVDEQILPSGLKHEAHDDLKDAANSEPNQGTRDDLPEVPEQVLTRSEEVTVPSVLEEETSSFMDEFTREFSEKYRQSLELEQNSGEVEDSNQIAKSQEQEKIHNTIPSVKEPDNLDYCDSEKTDCSIKTDSDQEQITTAVPDLVNDHLVSTTSSEDYVQKLDIQLSNPSQANEPTVDIAIASSDVVNMGINEIDVVSSDASVDGMINDTSSQEVGDPLGEVYFGILKEYLCKIEVVFEKTPRAALMTLVVGVLYIIFVTLKMVLRKNSKESQLSVELSNLQSIVHKYSVERNHYNKLLTAERQKSQSLEDSMNEMSEKYSGYQESFDKIKSERKLFENECTRLKSKLSDEHEHLLKIQREQQEVDDENSNIKVQLKQLTDEVQQLKSDRATTNTSLQTAQSTIECLELTIEQLQEEKESIIDQNEDIKIKIDQVTKERDELKDRVKDLQEELDELKIQLKRKTDELDTLNKSVQELDAIKDSVDPDKQYHDVLDLVQIRVKLSSLVEENEILSRKVAESEETRKHLEDEAISLREKFLESEDKSKKALEERSEAVKNLEVLTKYFKEREVEMQKELGAQQVRRMQKEEDATSLEKRLQSIEEENELYKSQCESMRKELADSERSFKSQLASLEKRAHDSWVAARNFEREVVELKNVSAFLRQKLTETAKSSHSLDGSDGVNGPDNSSLFEFMPPPPPMPPVPLPPSMDFMMNSQRPSSSASGPWDLGPMPPPPPMPPLGMPFMPGMPPFNPHLSYSDYSNRLSPSSRQSQSPAYSYSADVANGDQSSLDYSSLNFSQSQQPQHYQQQPQQEHQHNQVHNQHEYVSHQNQQSYSTHHQDQSNC